VTSSALVIITQWQGRRTVEPPEIYQWALHRSNYIARPTSRLDWSQIGVVLSSAVPEEEDSRASSDWLTGTQRERVGQLEAT